QAMKHYTKLFRQHDTAPEVAASAIYRQLTTEWVALQTRPTTRRTLDRWTRTEPALAGLHSPGAIVDAIDDGSKPRKDEILGALIRLTHDGQHLAGRIVLQAMMPKLARIAMNAVPDSGNVASFVEDSRHETLAEFWDVLATYPIERRPSSVAGGLALDTLNRVVRSRQKHHQAEQVFLIPLEPAEVMLDRRAMADESEYGVYGAAMGRVLQELSHTPRPTAFIDVDSPLLEVIAWGARSSAITVAEAKLLVEVYLPDKTEGWGFDTVAARHGWTVAATRQRCSRVVRKLTAAVRAEVSVDLAAPENEAVAA